MTEQERMARPLAEVDPEISEAIRNETERQNSHLELIASENFTSQAILEATGSVFTNKYAEGYPGQALLRRLRVHRYRREIWRASEPRSCFTPNTPTFSRTPDRRPTKPPMPAC